MRHVPCKTFIAFLLAVLMSASGITEEPVEEKMKWVAKQFEETKK